MRGSECSANTWSARIQLICNGCRILSQLRAAAGAHTKLLIGDMLLPYACADDPDGSGSESDDVSRTASPKFVPSDSSPLLPNVGKANVHGYLVDINIMVRFRAACKMVSVVLFFTRHVVDVGHVGRPGAYC